MGIIKLDRPKQLNALCGELMAELQDVLKSFGEMEEIRAVVLTGSEKAFAAGADISEMSSLTASDCLKRDYLSDWTEMFARFRKPVIAAVSGYAVVGR